MSSDTVRTLNQTATCFDALGLHGRAPSVTGIITTTERTLHGRLSPEEEVRQAVSDARLARYPGLDEEMQERLAVSGSDIVRSYLAQNPCITPGVQEILARDAEAQHALAENPSLHVALQERFLAFGGYLAICVARNPRLAVHLQESIWHSQEVPLQKQLAKNENLLPHLQLLAAQGGGILQRLVAENPKVTLEAQHVLVASADMAIFRSLAENSNLSPSLHRALSLSHDKMTGVLLARRSDLVWSENLGALFVKHHAPALYQQVAGDLVEETNALVGNWRGSLQDLVTACELTRC